MTTDLKAYDPDGRFDAYDKDALKECLLAQQEHRPPASAQAAENRDEPQD